MNETAPRTTLSHQNVLMLKLLMQLYAVKNRDVLQALGEIGYKTSKAYLSRLFNDPSFTGSNEFWKRLNEAMPKLLRPEMLCQTFQTEHCIPENADELLKGLAVVESRPTTPAQVSKVSMVA